MKKIILLGVVAVAFASSTMAEVNSSAVKSYVGLGFNTISISSKLDNSSSSVGAGDSGSAVSINGGAKLNKKARVNFYSYSSKVKSAGKPFFDVAQIGISYDYKLGNREKQGWFVGGGIAKTTVKIDANILGNKITSSKSSTGLLLRGGYEVAVAKDLLLIAVYNIDLGKQKAILESSSVLNGIGIETSVGGLGVSINYTF